MVPFLSRTKKSNDIAKTFTVSLPGSMLFLTSRINENGFYAKALF